MGFLDLCLITINVLLCCICFAMACENLILSLTSADVWYLCVLHILFFSQYFLMIFVIQLQIWNMTPSIFHFNMTCLKLIIKTLLFFWRIYLKYDVYLVSYYRNITCLWAISRADLPKGLTMSMSLWLNFAPVSKW